MAPLLTALIIGALIRAPIGVAPVMHTFCGSREGSLIAALIRAVIRAPMGIGSLIDSFNKRFNKGANWCRPARAHMFWVSKEGSLIVALIGAVPRAPIGNLLPYCRL